MPEMLENVGESVRSTGWLGTLSKKWPSTGYQDEVAPTIQSGRMQSAVAFMQNGDNETYICGDGTRANALCSDFGVKQQNYICISGDASKASIDENIPGTLKSQGGFSSVVTDTLVRRLRPLECERLQGFPDNYTNVEYRGKPASDTQRYKALGNSMAVPVMEWIGKRIQKVSELIS